MSSASTAFPNLGLQGLPGCLRREQALLLKIEREKDHVYRF
jgi:hypothetical protein